MGNSKNDGTGVLLEQIIHQNKVLIEQMGDMRHNVNKLPAFEEDLQQIKNDLATIKLVVTDSNKHINNHQKRIFRLETKVA